MDSWVVGIVWAELDEEDCFDWEVGAGLGGVGFEVVGFVTCLARSCSALACASRIPVPRASRDCLFLFFLFAIVSYLVGIL